MALLTTVVKQAGLEKKALGEYELLVKKSLAISGMEEGKVLAMSKRSGLRRKRKLCHFALHVGVRMAILESLLTRG